MNKVQANIIASIGMAGNYGYEGYRSLNSLNPKQQGTAIYIPKRHKFKRRNK